MGNKFYKGYNNSIKRYQKSEKYKMYTRKYERTYRALNKVEVSFSSWYCMRLSNGKRTTTELINAYLLAKYAGFRYNNIEKELNAA